MQRFSIILLMLASIFAISCNSGDTYRVMSYNVHHCRGVDDSISYSRIAEIINRVAPDFVALQELDSATVRNNGKVCIDELASETGMVATYASAIRFDGGSYGIGLLSKEQPLSSRVVPLVSRGETRRLLVVEFENCVVCCTHFALDADDRKASAEIVVDALKGYKKPLFLAGDMNCYIGDPEQKVLESHFEVLNNADDCTYPSINPAECIDFVYSLNNGFSYKVNSCKVLSDDSIASDHLPLFVEVVVK